MKNIKFTLSLLFVLTLLLISNNLLAQDINGQNVQSITATGGVIFASTGNGTWIEYGTDGSERFYFTEINRDAWSVYLKDTNRANTEISIDLWKKKVNFNKKPIYDIIDSSLKGKVPNVDTNVSSIAWITKNYAKLKDKPLNELVIPGTHNSASYSISYPKISRLGLVLEPQLFSPDKDKSLEKIASLTGPVFDGWARCQSKDIYTQLKDGIRFLDIRIAAAGAEFYTCHGRYMAPLSKVLSDIKKFSDEYPNEPIIIDILSYNVWPDNNKADLRVLEDLIDQNLGDRLASKKLNPNSKLSEFMENKRPIVLIVTNSIISKLNNSELAQNYFWIHSDVENTYSARENDGELFDRLPLTKHLDETLKNRSMSKFHILAGQITPNVELYFNAVNPIPLSNIPRELHGAAKSTNPVVLNYTMTRWKDFKYNIIYVDFYTFGSIVEVCKKLNGLDANPVGASDVASRNSNWGSWKNMLTTAENVYKVVIDACHNDISHEESNNQITVKFWADDKLVATKSKKGDFGGCWLGQGKSGGNFIIESQEYVTKVTIETNGDDGFYIDQLWLYQGGKEIKHEGRQNGNGWCLSKDRNDYGGWEGQVEPDVCHSIVEFSYK